jgi:hypothetical protein
LGCAHEGQSEKESFQWLHEHLTVTKTEAKLRLDYSNRTVCSWKLNNDVYQGKVRELWVLNEVKNLQSNNARLSVKKKLIYARNFRTTITTTTVFFFSSTPR